MANIFEKYASNRERRAINQCIVHAISAGSSSPVTDAWFAHRTRWDKNTFFTAARTLGYSVKKSAGLWTEVVKTK